MAEAFKCDACDSLEAGKPAQRVTVKPVMGTSEDLDLCTACLVSHNEWRVSRAPIDPDRYA